MNALKYSQLPFLVFLSLPRELRRLKSTKSYTERKKETQNTKVKS